MRRVTWESWVRQQTLATELERSNHTVSMDSHFLPKDLIIILVRQTTSMPGF